MKIELLNRLLGDDDPLVPLFEKLRGIWSEESFAQHKDAADLEAYLQENEHWSSEFEREVWDVFADVYDWLEGDHPRKHVVDGLREQEEFTLVIFDGLSLRELPALLEVFAEANLGPAADFALAEVPSETEAFTRAHFSANGPSEIASSLLTQDFAFRHVKRTDWEPDFSDDERRRVIWALYPDNVFNLDSGAVDYAAHVVEPVQAILGSVLAGDPVLPLVVTGDHGYLWQGGAAAWDVTDAEEGALLAAEFKGGRSTDNANSTLMHTDKAWRSDTGEVAAARGRFAWGGRVKGATKLFKHGGVSLMECMTPRVSAGLPNG